MSEALFALVAAALVVCAPVLTLVAQQAPQPGETALVITAPWGPGAAEIVTAAQTPRISPVDPPLGALVALGDDQSVQRLYDEGAWLVARGDLLLELCAD
jgi:predicted naringenin-chalcone synthase